MRVRRSWSKRGDVVLMSLVLAAFLSQSLETLLLRSVGESNTDRQSLFTDALPVVVLNDCFADFRGRKPRSVRCYPCSWGIDLPSEANTTTESIHIA